MINFNYENNFKLHNELELSQWIENTILSENSKLGDINYIFCDDHYLLNLNQEFLKHDTLTDIITFDYSVGKILNGDIFISTERVSDNALDYNVSFNEEMLRVIIHGVLHLCGYKDKTEKEALLMRTKEDQYLKQFSSIK